MVTHVLKFAGLVALMYALAFVPTVGMYVNIAIVLYGIWKASE